MSVPFALLTYKLATLACGLASIFMGYRLFRSGITASAGDVEAGISGHSLSLVNAAPGTVFAAFGMVIIATTTAQGFHLRASETAPPVLVRDITPDRGVTPRENITPLPSPPESEL
jgi:hypothetical protein